MSEKILSQDEHVNSSLIDKGRLAMSATKALLAAASANGLQPFPIQGTAWVCVTGAGYVVEVAIVEVTPEMAAEFLRRMANNRRTRGKNVERIARDIAKGAWAFTGEPLLFDEFGMMIDGQHRCRAGILSKKSFVALIVRGVPRASFDRLDGGDKRNPGDVLGAAGVDHKDLVAAAMALLLNKRNGGPWYECRAGLYTPHDIGKSAYLFPGLEGFAPIAKDLTRVLGNKASFWLAARYLTAQKDQEKSRLFFAKIATGLGLNDPNEPEHLLRNKLSELHRKEHRLAYPELAAIVTNAWNNSRKGKKISALRGLQGNAPVPAFV